ncbi:hypothetical protein Q4I32_007163 [Leishmania shawi]|uniref:Uncharacterized protein n=1 Tax=Leishmania shawi TaxID=5680 RepID=A0AAW3BCJ5_9TRYP
MYPNSTTLAAQALPIALSPVEVERTSYALGGYDTQPAHTSPVMDATLPGQQGGSALPFLRGAGGKNRRAPGAVSGVSSLLHGAQATSPSSAYPPLVGPRTQLKSMTDGTRVNCECARHALSSRCGSRDLDSARMVRPRGTSGSDHADSGTLAAHPPVLQQPTYTSYAIHRVLPRVAHPYFTTDAQYLFQHHHTSRPDSSAHAYLPPQYALSGHTSKGHSLPLSVLYNAEDVLESLVYTPPTAVTTTHLSFRKPKACDNGAASLLRARAGLDFTLPPVAQPNTAVTAPLLLQHPHRPLPYQAASLRQVASVTPPSGAQVQRELTETESFRQPLEAPRTAPDPLLDFTAKAPMAVNQVLLPASSANIAVVPSTLSSFPLQLEKGSRATVSATTQQRQPHALQTPTLASPNLCGSDDGRGASGGAALCLASMFTPFQQQLRRHYHHHPFGATLPMAATLGSSDMYNKRNVQRGTWVFVLARQECLARELLEAEETNEALRCLPASCTVWRTYYRPTSGSAEHGAACLASSTGSDTLTSSGVFTASTAALGTSCELFSALDDADASCVAPRETPPPHPCGVERKVGGGDDQALVTPPPHPAFAMAVYWLELLESILRGEVRTEEGDAFRSCLEKPCEYEHRLLSVGTLPLEQFLRSWIEIHRARKLHHVHQLAKMEDMEHEARTALYVASETLQRRFQLMRTALVEQEHHYRCTLELLWTQVAAWVGVVLLRLQEQVERFPLAFGSAMSRTRLCGRVTGLNRFSNLVEVEQAFRKTIRNEEIRQRVVFPTEFEMRVVCLMYEPRARKELLKREATERAVAHQVVNALQTHYSIREVEIEESIERQFWLTQLMHSGVDLVVVESTTLPHRLRDVALTEVEM